MTARPGARGLAPDRRGAALLLAVVLLALLGAIAASAVELARAEHRNGLGILAATQASAAAEAALAEAAQGWPSASRPRLPGAVAVVWSGAFPQGVQAELELVATGGAFVVMRGRGRRVAAGGPLSQALVEGVALVDSFPGDSLERPRRPPRWRWHAPP